jgi:hypothetical protein
MFRLKGRADPGIFKGGVGGESPLLVFKEGGGIQYWSKEESTFKIPLEYIKFDEVRGKTYTNRTWQMKWNPSTTTKCWILLWEYCKGT